MREGSRPGSMLLQPKPTSLSTRCQLNRRKLKPTRCKARKIKRRVPKKSKEASAMQNDPKYIDACKVLKGLDAPNGNFMIQVTNPPRREVHGSNFMMAIAKEIEDPIAHYKPKKSKKAKAKDQDHDADKPLWMCSTPSCRKPSWNQEAGQYCSRKCRSSHENSE